MTEAVMRAVLTAADHIPTTVAGLAALNPTAAQHQRLFFQRSHLHHSTQTFAKRKKKVNWCLSGSEVTAVDKTLAQFSNFVSNGFSLRNSPFYFENIVNILANITLISHPIERHCRAPILPPRTLFSVSCMWMHPGA